MRVLGIETSCDETAAAVYDSERGLLAHALHSQIDMHIPYGGVVPELASRDHIRKTLPLIKTALQQAETTPCAIHGVAYTLGPGLLGALLVGAAIGRSLAYAWNVPAVGIHHMEAHLLVACLENPAPALPFIALLVSGGHTLLVHVEDVGHYKILGQSLDDAAGEAFDKTAKLLGLPYPGGPALAKLATTGDPKRFRFPRPMTDRSGLNFSFSGLKTHAVQVLQKAGGDAQTCADIARAFEDAIVDTLIVKCLRALRSSGLSRLVVAGGVGANQRLRVQLAEAVRDVGGEVYYPKPQLCTDNAVMIAYTGLRRLQAGQRESLIIDAKPRWPLEDLDGIAAAGL